VKWVQGNNTAVGVAEVFEVGRLLNFAKAIAVKLCNHRAPPGESTAPNGALCRAGCWEPSDRVRLRVPAAVADAAVLFCGLGRMWEIAQMSQMPCYVQRPLPSEDGAPAQVAAPLAARVGRDGLLQWLEHLAHRPVSHTHMQPHIVGLRQTCIHVRRCSYLRGPL
jgi:hypothetical protein